MRRLPLLLLVCLLVALAGETTDLLCAEAGCGVATLGLPGGPAPGEEVPDGAVPDDHAPDPDGCDGQPADAGASACLCHAVFSDTCAHVPALSGRSLWRAARPTPAEPARPPTRTDAVPVPPPMG